MKKGKSIVELATELQRRSEAKTDFLVPSSSVTMLAEAPELLTANVNDWLSRKSDRRMVRTMDGSARAFLSDRYRRFDNEDVMEAVLPVLMESSDIRVESADVTDTRLYLKAVFPKLEGEVKRGDVVQAGVVISNSEIGLGSIKIQPMVFRLVCLNGMIAEDSGLNRYHVGRRVDGDGVDVAQLFRDETLQADDRALQLKIADVVRGAMAEAQFKRLIEKMVAATEGAQIEQPVAAVEILAKKVGLNGEEKNSALLPLIRGGDFSRWGVLNAVTEIANTHNDYDRATEIESIGGQILNLPAGEWREIAEAA